MEEYRALCNLLFVADTLACTTPIGCPLSARGQLLGDHCLKAACVSTPMIEEVMDKLPLRVRFHLS
jgi:hypothetical protein